MSESEWLALEAAKGDPAAFGHLVRQHQSRLRGFLMRLTKGSSALADDLAQDTFIEAYKKIGQFNSSNFFGWLCAIAWSRFLMEARKRKLESLEALAEAGTDFSDDAPEPENASLIKHDLESAMAQLAPMQRAALTLCFALGLSNEEAAQSLNIPLGTLKSHVNRGRAKLEILLGDWRKVSVS
jgi:RNA polymerase sigma factor (sigma-70 family)